MAGCRGFTKVGNEAHIIQDTLDIWAEYCPDGIHVYCDCCTDGTDDICRSHPAVVEVISSNLYHPDRAHADMFNRQQVLNSVLRYVAFGEWVAYFDADEHLFDFPMEALDEPVQAIAPHWYDVYITPEDKDEPYQTRDWVSSTDRLIPLFYRHHPRLGFHRPDQRIMSHAVQDNYPLRGHLRHYGLGFSEELWERKVRYYQEWPLYAGKWAQRGGQAIRSDYTAVTGEPLQRYSQLRRSNDPHRRLRPVA